MERSQLTENIIKQMDPEELNSILLKTFVKPIPISIENIEDMNTAGRLMASLTNDYSYLSGVLSSLKISAKIAKSQGSKVEYNEMVMRRDCVDIIVDIVKQQYSALSRLITIKQEINNELKMTMC
jgi:hypothetical protein